MKLYLIGGLGADERVFKYLKLNIETEVIKWLEPMPKEKLSHYSNRVKNQINTNEEFGLLGVSFGGIIAIELAKILKPQKLILISSVERREQLPQTYLLIGKTKLLNIIPNSIIKPPIQLLGFLFGAKKIEILKQIVDDTDPDFIRWALSSILSWSHQVDFVKPIRIHGTNDRIIPLKGQAFKIKDGGHFMIVDKAEEISTLVNEQLQ